MMDNYAVVNIIQNKVRYRQVYADEHEFMYSAISRIRQFCYIVSILIIYILLYIYINYFTRSLQLCAQPTNI
jgi:hypothetical protein